jgi:hypothetical protein
MPRKKDKDERSRLRAYACRMGREYWLVSAEVGGKLVNPQTALAAAIKTRPLAVYSTLAEAARAASEVCLLARPA